MKNYWILQRFTEGGEEGGAEDKGANNGGTTPEIDYEKLASIVSGKQSAATDSVLRGYFKQQGMSKEDMETAIAEFKERQAENDPTKLLAEARAELESYKNKDVLKSKGVAKEYEEFVAYKAKQVAKEKKLTFDKAVDKVLKDNPVYKTSGNAYRVSTGTQAGGSAGNEGSNSQVNDAIRNAFRR